MSEEIKDTEVTEQNNTEEKETRSFTEDELQKLIESESDKKLDKALKTAKANWESDFEKKLEERIAEEKRIANLSEKERQEEELSQREQALAEREKQIKLSEIRSDAINELNERGLDTRFVDYLVSDDSEQTFERIKEFNALIDDVVNKEIKSLTRQSPIKVGGTNLNTKNETNTDVLDIARQSRIIK